MGCSWVIAGTTEALMHHCSDVLYTVVVVIYLALIHWCTDPLMRWCTIALMYYTPLLRWCTIIALKCYTPLLQWCTIIALIPWCTDANPLFHYCTCDDALLRWYTIALLQRCTVALLWWCTVALWCGDAPTIALMHLTVMYWCVAPSSLMWIHSCGRNVILTMPLIVMGSSGAMKCSDTSNFITI